MTLIRVHSSTIIEDVWHHCQSDMSFAIAYFYFDFSDKEKQQSENLLRSLITQLSSHNSGYSDTLTAVFSKSKNGQRQPTLEDLLITLKHMIRGFQHTYVIVDALDECQDREQLLALIEEIMSWKLGSLHILATSRQEREIEDCVGPRASAQVDLHSALVDADIEAYIHESLRNDPKLRKWSTKVHGQIETALMEGAHG